MSAPIKESRWGEIIIYPWSAGLLHQWECFRLALIETTTEVEPHGVAVEFSTTTNETVTVVDAQGVNILYSPVIMQSKSEMIVSIVVSERDYKTDMVKYLPLYERKSIVFNEILNSYDRELRNSEQQLEVVERNLFLDTAIESLPVFERDLGIKPNGHLRYDQRREQIASRNRASFDQTTEETIKSVAKAFSNGEVEVNKTSTVGLFEIKFIGTKGIPNNMDGLKEALDIIIPAHLGLTYTFTFNAWEFYTDRTWGSVATMNWNDMKIWDEVS